MTLNIQQKGLVIVFVPLFFQVVFIAVLAALFHQAEADLRLEVRAASLASLTSSLNKLYYDTVTAAFIWRTTKSELFAKRYDDNLKEIEKEEAQMRSLLSSDEKQKSLMRRLEEDVKAGKEFMHRVRFDKEEENDFLQLRSVQKEGHRLVERLQESGASVAQYAREVENRSNLSSAGSRGRVVFFLWLFVVVNILGAVALTLYYTRGITKRLALLTENAEHLSKNEPLNAPLTLDDELGAVDRAFHEAARALNEASLKERSLIKNAADVLCSVSNQGEFISVSEAAKKVWGYEPAALVGQSLGQLIPADEKATFVAAIKELVSTSAPGNLESGLIRRDGKIVVMRWAMHWSFAEGALFCVAHDISVERELEASKQLLMDTVAHDLRTPLSSIQLILGMLEEETFGPQSDEAKVRLQRAMLQTRRLVRLVNDLLDFDKLESGSMPYYFQVVEVGTLLDSAIDAVAEQARQEAVDIEVVGNLEQKIKIDLDRMLQAVVNLLSNALKFSTNVKDAKILVRVQSNQGLLLLEVLDRGPGVPSQDRELIFERFKQSENQSQAKSKGTGLGLPIARLIVLGHGGKIGVLPRDGGGSNFFISLPAFS